MGYIKPKAAAILDYLAQLMLQAQERAKAEFLQSGRKSWSKIVRMAPAFQTDEPDSDDADSLPEPDSCDSGESDPDSDETGPATGECESVSDDADSDSAETDPAPAGPVAPPSDDENLVSFPAANSL